MSRQRLQNANLEDRAKGLTEEHVSQIKAYFTNEIWELSRQCKLRYRCVLSIIAEIALLMC